MNTLRIVHVLKMCISNELLNDLPKKISQTHSQSHMIRKILKWNSPQRKGSESLS